MAVERVSKLRTQGNLICWLEKRMEGEIQTDALYVPSPRI